MYKAKFFKSFIVILLALGICSIYQIPVVGMPSKTTLKQKLKQTNDKRFYFRVKRQQADLKLKNERNKLSNNQQKLEDTTEKLNNTTVQYNELVTDLQTTQNRLNIAIQQFKTLDAEVKTRIKQLYKHQRPGMFELILSANSVTSLLDTFYYEKIVITKDYQKMRQAKAKADEIAALKIQVESQKALVAASLRDIQSQKSVIQSSIATNKSMIEKLQKDKNYYERSERELARQSANIENMIASLVSSKKTSTVHVSSTGFSYPISGPITSPFGWRVHPIFKSRIFHSGIDIGGPNGGSIRASNDGKVIYTGWYGGYGKVVILDHGIINGKPITTLYAHMSAILVSNGQYVKKGQTVGREGSTGYSTGPHCHFEVRVNGKPTNPLNYL